jgi:hypothetical protein
MQRFAHVVQLRLTRDEYEVLDQLAAGRQITIEDLLREHLGFAPPRTKERVSGRSRERHLSITHPEPA